MTLIKIYNIGNSNKKNKNYENF